MGSATRDHKFEYWKDSLECALDEVGAAAALSPEQIERVAGSLESSAENQGMAFGRDAIPNPLAAELSAAERRNEARKQAAEDRETELKGTIADLHYRIRDLEYKLAEAKAAKD